jgi:hypothetical protein
MSLAQLLQNVYSNVRMKALSEYCINFMLLATGTDRGAFTFDAYAAAATISALPLLHP